MAIRLRTYPASVAAILLWAGGSACSPSRPVQPGNTGLRVAASASLVGNPDTVRVRLQIINTRTDTQTVHWDECRQTGPANAIRAYHQDDKSLAWDWWPASAKIVCDLMPHSAMLQPGDSVTILGRVPVADILGDSLPTGVYNLTVTPTYLEPSYPKEFSLGEFSLKR